MSKGQRLVVMSMTFMEDIYAVARMRVPYRPAEFQGGMDCNSAEDVFKLYWRYTSPERMGYMSWTSRKLHRGGSHEEKILGELQQKRVTVLALEKDKPVPEWARPVVKAFKASGGTVVPVQLVRSLPPGIIADAFNYYEKKAWRILYSYLRTRTWPDHTLEVFSEVGKGKDSSAGATDKARAGKKAVDVEVDSKESKAASRLPLPHEIEQLLRYEGTVEEIMGNVRLNPTGRRLVEDAHSEGLMRKGEHMMLKDGIIDEDEMMEGRKHRMFNKKHKEWLDV